LFDVRKLFKVAKTKDAKGFFKISLVKKNIKDSNKLTSESISELNNVVSDATGDVIKLTKDAIAELVYNEYYVENEFLPFGDAEEGSIPD
jgi:hypothetical protein